MFTCSGEGSTGKGKKGSAKVRAQERTAAKSQWCSQPKTPKPHLLLPKIISLNINYYFSKIEFNR